jgi:L-lysine 2,3-aminomutase
LTITIRPSEDTAMPHGTPGHDIPRSGDGRFGSFTVEDLEALTARAGLTPGQSLRTRAAAAVLGFRTTSYVTELIDWAAAPEDPIYRLVFPDADMLPAGDVNRIADMLRRQVPQARIAAAARQARSRLAGDHVPPGAGNVLPGAYRTSRDTVMIWPARRPSPRPSGISCFDGVPLHTGPGGVMTRGNISLLARYLTANPEVTCVHFAGHDLLTMTAPALRAYIRPLLRAGHLEAIRIDTSVLAHWPRRFLTDPDAGDTLRLLSQAAASGKTLALTARFSHTRQLQSQLIGDSVRQVRGTGAVIRTLVPLIGSVNDDANLLADMWRAQVRLGMVPDSVVIERGTGQGGKFAMPLARAHDIFLRAYAQVSGLARTARGPAMPTVAGTVCITGIADIGAQKAFVLCYTQASDPGLIGRPFFAAFDPGAAWFTDLTPAPGAAFPGELRADPRQPGR